ncbi:hypothetical protein [Paracoccus liaowanqingii]|uniref:hypothetical protein n=1 Tax=Paracoccus liaowanqingii TaxID=2560053 RepID=UPI00143D4536|nr:hypothetical protein [Paracoccus liaowanqingii]
MDDPKLEAPPLADTSHAHRPGPKPRSRSQEEESVLHTALEAQIRDALQDK